MFYKVNNYLLSLIAAWAAVRWAMKTNLKTVLSSTNLRIQALFSCVMGEISVKGDHSENVGINGGDPLVQLGLELFFTACKVGR